MKEILEPVEDFETEQIENSTTENPVESEPEKIVVITDQSESEDSKTDNVILTVLGSLTDSVASMRAEQLAERTQQMNDFVSAIDNLNSKLESISERLELLKPVSQQTEQVSLAQEVVEKVKQKSDRRWF